MTDWAEALSSGATATGLSHSWVIPDDEQLTARRTAVVRHTERYAAEHQAYEDATVEAGAMRGCINVDVEQIGRDFGGGCEVIERPEGGVWVFDPTA